VSASLHLQNPTNPLILQGIKEAPIIHNSLKHSFFLSSASTPSPTLRRRMKAAKYKARKFFIKGKIIKIRPTPSPNNGHTQLI